jgi:penicillin-binding protein 1A
VIRQVKTVSGELVYARTGTGLGRVVDSGTVGMMNLMLRETLATGTARKAELPGWDAAGKTGTSQDYRDAWFVGYTGSLVAGVWLGNDDGSPTKRVSGSNLPTEVWSKFMRTALANQPSTGLPGGGPGGWRPAGSPEAPPPLPPMSMPSSPQPGEAAPAQRAPAQGPMILVPPAPVAQPAGQPAPAQVGSIPVPPAAPRRSTAQSDVPRPPGSIPGAGPAPMQGSPPPAPQRNFFDRMFGG